MGCAPLGVGPTQRRRQIAIDADHIGNPRDRDSRDPGAQPSGRAHHDEQCADYGQSGDPGAVADSPERLWNPGDDVDLAFRHGDHQQSGTADVHERDQQP